MARELGFETIGIVSTQALSYSGKFSPFVQRIYIVNDLNWGGYLPGSTELTPATKAYLGVSDIIAAFGGGMNTAVTLKEAKARGIQASYIPFDMNHERAIKEAHGKETDFRGAACIAWKELEA